MMKKQLALLPFLLMISVQFLFGQSDISMTTQWNNRANFNPASISRTEYMYLFTNARRQWVGINGSPTVLNIQASEYIHSMKSAFGLSLVSDNVGLTSVINPMATFAYRISPDLDEKSWALSFGLAAGMFMRSIDGSQYDAQTTVDPAINYQDVTSYKPDANLGIELQLKYFTFGLSTTHLFAINKADNTFLNTNHRYLYGIYKNTNSEYMNFSLGLQCTNRNNLTFYDVNTMVRFKHPTGLYDGPKELFEVGMSYRTTKQFSLLAGIFLARDLRVGYAYTMDFQLKGNQQGTHEIMLEWRIPTKASTTCETCKGDGDWYF
jgi:type IX secretion system PorP/SprF family membrane protein